MILDNCNPLKTEHEKVREIVFGRERERKIERENDRERVGERKI